MAGLSLVQAQTNLDNANAALAKAMEAESWSEGGRSVSRNLEALEKSVSKWERQVKRLTSGGTGGPRVRLATPV